MQGAEADERCQKVVLMHRPMATAKAEGLEGPQEAGGKAVETDPMRCETTQVGKARVRRKNAFLRLEQLKFTGVNSFAVCAVILTKPSSLMSLSFSHWKSMCLVSFTILKSAIFFMVYAVCCFSRVLIAWKLTCFIPKGILIFIHAKLHLFKPHLVRSSAVFHQVLLQTEAGFALKVDSQL